MKEQFVTWDIALKLQKLGFNEDTLGFFDPAHKEVVFSWMTLKTQTFVKAPLWQQCLDWLREKHKIFVNITSYENNHTVDINDEYIYSPVICNELYRFGKYYTAREQAILKAIELIK